MKFTILSFFSHLAGSTLGILGGLGFLMTQIEGRFERKRKPVVKEFMQKILKRRTELINFSIANEVELNTSSAKEHSTDTILTVQKPLDTVLDLSLNTSLNSFKMYGKLSKRAGLFRNNNKILPLGHEII
jgi:hypothetical protein